MPWRAIPIASARRSSSDAVRWDEADLDDLLDGMSRMEFMLRFTLTHPDMNTTIVGTANLEHLAENVAVAAKGALPADQYEATKARLDALD